MSYRKRLELWFDDPNTQDNAWMELPFSEIDRQAEVNPHNACVQLPKIIAERTGKTEAEVREQRMQYRYKRGLAKRP